MGDKNMLDVDLYELLGIDVNCTVQDVKKAYRKKALSCHPDKNPDNPRAAELFHELSRALEILTDESARAAYDKVLRARKAAKLRHKELDSRRKKLKEDLEAREKKAEELAARKRNNFDTRTDEEKLQAEIERLRKEGSKQLEEEVEYVRRQVELEKENKKGASLEDNSCSRLTLRWSCDKSDETNGGYSYDTLHKMFCKYGDIVALVVLPKKKGRALVEFQSREAAELAVQLEKGLASNPLTVDWLQAPQAGKAATRSGPRLSDMDSGNKPGLFPSVGKGQAGEIGHGMPSFSFDPDFQEPQSQVDLEDMVFRRLRQAEERKRLIEELKNEDS
ncbi:dnaJ homolog subfamily C member 17 [Anabrus simplex]|uniref:dnaJ homolog subfamily C member 17 n=1 Tax=Anabrus simplex TaxID=316456 RepID=UPI0035A27541